MQQMPPIEPLVTSHLHPKTSMSSSASFLPSKADCFQSSLTGKCYKAVALAARVLNASALLKAYQAKLEEDMTVRARQYLWEEIYGITDHIPRLHKVAVQATGRSKGLMVLQGMACWLGLTNLATKEKEELLGTLSSPRVSLVQLSPLCRRDVKRKREMMRH